MKRFRSFAIFLFSLVLLIFVMQINSAHALSCSAENQIIFRLSSETNAHAEVWNGTGEYDKEICYGEIFGSSYSFAEGEDPHACTGSNGVIFLSSETNAHAEIIKSPEQQIYDKQICFGDLNCRHISDINDKTEEEFPVVRLSGENNAHLELPGNENYGTIIVCSSSSGEFGETGWVSFTGQEIEQTCVGRTARIKISNTFQTAEDVIIKIFRNDLFADSEIDVIEEQVSSGDQIVEWVVDNPILDDGDEIYFTVEHVGNPELIFDGKAEDKFLTVKAGENCVNTKPRATILTPENGALYLEDSEVQIEGLCEDDESSVVYNWEIKEASLGVVEFTSDQASFEYTASGSGQKIITLECIDEDSASDIDRVSILSVGDGSGVLAFIDEPEYESVVQDDNRVVDYSAGSSYAIEANINSNSCGASYIKCLGGSCPTEVTGFSSEWINSCGSDIIVDENGKRGFFEDLNFEWDFGDGFIEKEDGKYQGRHRYAETSNTRNDKIIELLLSLSSNQEVNSGIDTRFTLVGGDMCVRGDAKSEIVDIDEQGNEIGTYKVGGVGGVSCNYLGSSCCPNGWSCNLNTGACELSEKTQCSDYETESECSEDSDHLANIDPARDSLSCGSIDPESGDTIVCSCGWSESKGQCALKSSFEPNGGSTPDQCVEPEAPSCTWAPAIGESYACGSGDTIKQITLEGEFDEGNCAEQSFIETKEAECTTKIVEIDCRKRGVQLPFVNNFALMVGLLFILIISLLQIRANKD